MRVLECGPGMGWKWQNSFGMLVSLLGVHCLLRFAKVGVRCFASGGEFVLRARFACIVADEKAIKETWSCKGASGTKMCLFM